MSTFTSDGYKDGFDGLHASPPEPYSFSGNTTTVFAAEYLQGWMQGRKARKERDDNLRGFERKGGLLNPV